VSIDFDQLEADYEAACIDKSDLFDFYNNNWGRLVREIERLYASRLSPEERESLAKFVKDSGENHAYGDSPIMSSAGIVALSKLLAASKGEP